MAWLQQNCESLKDDSSESILADIESHCCHEFEWRDWLYEDCEIYDLESIGDCGFVVPIRARLWHIGLKLAVAQLPEDYQMPSASWFPSEPAAERVCAVSKP